MESLFGQSKLLTPAQVQKLLLRQAEGKPISAADAEKLRATRKQLISSQDNPSKVSSIAHLEEEAINSSLNNKSAEEQEGEQPINSLANEGAAEEGAAEEGAAEEGAAEEGEAEQEGEAELGARKNKPTGEKWWWW